MNDHKHPLILAIDAGSKKSGWVMLRDGVPEKWGWDDNREVAMIYDKSWSWDDCNPTLVIEDIAHYGMPVGRDVFETVKWMGRFDTHEVAHFIPRNDVKVHLCGSPRANDSTVRQALIDRYGGDRVAFGVKCSDCRGKGWIGRGRPPCVNCDATGWEVAEGPLVGIASHVWSALAVGLTYLDRQNGGKPQ